MALARKNPNPEQTALNLQQQSANEPMLEQMVISDPKQLNQLVSYSVRLPEFAITMTDSQSSSSQEKHHGVQKLFLVNNCYIMGTGSASAIQYVADTLRNSHIQDPQKLSTRIMQIINNDLRISDSEKPNFIVAGYIRNQIEMFHLIASQYIRPQKMNTNFAIDGSGSQFVANAITRDQANGSNTWDTTFDTPADVAAKLLDFGYAASSSLGVNSDLQLGIITSIGTGTLFNTNSVHVKNPPKEYKHDVYDLFDPQKAQTNLRRYTLLLKTLANMNDAKRHITYGTNLFLAKRITQEQFNEGLNIYSGQLSTDRYTANQIILEHLLQYNKPSAKNVDEFHRAFLR